MKISNISTGNKLNVKTFGELKVGDTIYWVHASETDLTDATWTVSDLFGKSTVKTYAYTDLKPDEKAPFKCNISLKIEDKYGTYCCNVPSNVKYIVSDDVVVTTTEESLFQLIKNYKLVSHLI